MSCFTTGGPGKPPPTSRVRERSKGDTTCPTTSQNPSRWHLSWLNKECTTRKDSESERLAKDNLETNPLPCCSLPARPFPIKSLALPAHVSPWTIHFRVLDKSPVSGPGRGPPSCNNSGTTLHTDDESLSCTYYRVNVMIWELDSNLKIVIDKGLVFFFKNSYKKHILS